MIISCHFEKPSYPFTFCWNSDLLSFPCQVWNLIINEYAKFQLGWFKIWKFRLHSYGFTLFLLMLRYEIITSGSYFALLEFCSWRTRKGIYFRRWFSYCCFGIWIKIINYWMSFEFFFLFTYFGVFNKTQFLDMLV